MNRHTPRLEKSQFGDLCECPKLIVWSSLKTTPFLFLFRVCFLDSLCVRVRVRSHAWNDIRLQFQYFLRRGNCWFIILKLASCEEIRCIVFRLICAPDCSTCFPLYAFQTIKLSIYIFYLLKSCSKRRPSCKGIILGDADREIKRPMDVSKPSREEEKKLFSKITMLGKARNA